jgi:hypothetical protein
MGLPALTSFQIQIKKEWLMGETHPNPCSDPHFFPDIPGEIRSISSRLVESATPDSPSADFFPPGPPIDNLSRSWEAAWIDLGGEG